LKSICAFRETWAPVLFFAALLGFVGLGISHVDANVRAAEAEAVANNRSEWLDKFLTDQDAFDQCARVYAVRSNRVEYGSLVFAQPLPELALNATAPECWQAGAGKTRGGSRNSSDGPFCLFRSHRVDADITGSDANRLFDGGKWKLPTPDSGRSKGWLVASFAP
jgi:hypothetical protein